MWGQDWFLLCLFSLPLGLAEKYEASDLSEFPIDIPNNTKEIIIEGEDCFLVKEAWIGDCFGQFILQFHMAPQSEPECSFHLWVTGLSLQDICDYKIWECDFGLSQQFQTIRCMKRNKKDIWSFVHDVVLGGTIQSVPTISLQHFTTLHKLKINNNNIRSVIEKPFGLSSVLDGEHKFQFSLKSTSWQEIQGLMQDI